MPPGTAPPPCFESGIGSPTSTSSFTPGQNMSISWFVGQAEELKNMSYSLYLHKYRDPDFEIKILGNLLDP
jgi:hypothetical protein